MVASLSSLASRVRNWRYGALRSVPSPPMSEWLGHLPQLSKAIRAHRMNAQLAEWAASYGSVIVVWLVTKPMVVLSKPKTIEDLLLKHQKDGSLTRSRVSRKAWESVFGGSTMESVVAEEWQWRRQAWGPSLTHKQLLEEQYANITRNAAGLLERIHALAQARESIETDLLFTSYSMRVISDMLFTNCGQVGVPKIDHETLYAHIATCEKQLVVEHLPQRVLKYLPLPSSKRYWKARRYVQAVIEPYVDFALGLRAAPPSTDSSNADSPYKSLLVQIALKQPRYTKESLTAEAFLLLAAGSDTTGHTLVYVLAVLARNPEVFARARAEVDGLWATGAGLAAETLQQLPYVQGVVREAMRLFPVAGGSFPCAVLKELSIEGHVIPKGAELFWSLLAASRNPEEYPNPDAVVPERWMGSTTPRLVSFGSGAHRCVGERLALMEATVICAQLIRELDWSFDESGPSPQLGVDRPTFYPEDRMPVRFTLRDSNLQPQLGMSAAAHESRATADPS